MLNYNAKLEEQNMAQVPFDTLEYAKMLIEAGMDRPLAEAQAEAQVKIIASLMQNKLATKDDIREVKDEINDVRNEIKDFKVDSELKFNEVEKNLSTKINEVDKNLSTKIDEVDRKLSAKIDEVDKRLSTKIDEVDKRLSSQIASLVVEINNLKNKIESMETRIVVKLGGIIVVALTAFGLVMKMCHF